MPLLSQLMVPGIVGISTYVDYVYHREMQLTAVRAAGTSGPINQLRSVTVTLNFNELVANLIGGQLEAAEEQVAVTAGALEAGGADFVVVTSGTTSTLTARARERVSIGFLDLAEAAWSETDGVGTVGLLCTRQATMGGIFHQAADRRKATLITPRPYDATRVDEVIFGELVHGNVSDGGVRVLRETVVKLADAGAESVILGNTDMALAIDQLLADAPVPLVDSARAHARATARAALHGVGPGLPHE